MGEKIIGEKKYLVGKLKTGEVVFGVEDGDSEIKNPVAVLFNPANKGYMYTDVLYGLVKKGEDYSINKNDLICWASPSQDAINIYIQMKTGIKIAKPGAILNNAMEKKVH